MMKIIYVCPEGDIMACRALQLLGEGMQSTEDHPYETVLLSDTKTVAWARNHHPTGALVGVFTAEGAEGEECRFPSRYVRLLTKDDPEKRKFVIPDWAKQLGYRIAINKEQPRPRPEICFKSAMMNIHCKIAHISPPPSVHIPKSEWARNRRRVHESPSSVTQSAGVAG